MRGLRRYRIERRQRRQMFILAHRETLRDFGPVVMRTSGFALLTEVRIQSLDLFGAQRMPRFEVASHPARPVHELLGETYGRYDYRLPLGRSGRCLPSSAAARIDGFGGSEWSTSTSGGESVVSTFCGQHQGERVGEIVMADPAYWSAIGRLWDRAIGGGDAAADPADWQSTWPSAPPAPGVAEFSDWLFSGPSSGSPRMLFLVGGPGAGKSHAASALVSGREPNKPPTDGLAAREYHYDFGDGRNLLLLNDATITSDRHRTGALAGDLRYALDKGWYVLACINRGVIVQELPRLDDQEDNEVADIVRWLHEEEMPDGALVSTGPTESREGNRSYAREATLERPSNVEVEMACVFMDVCSLLEPRPNVVISPSSSPAESPDVDVGSYYVTPLGDRGKLASSDMSAALLFEGALRDLPNGAGAGPLDPIAANLQSLRSPRVREGLMTVLRVAEIVAAQRFSFRELWGAVARCAVGDLTEVVNADGVEEWLCESAPDETATPSERFDAMQRLASLRFSQSLFTVASDRLEGPVTRLTRPVDPARDAVPGWVDKPGSGWVTPVLNAFAASEVVDSPLDGLLGAIERDDPMHDGVTQFDRELDRAVVEALNAVPRPSDLSRRRILSWYGAYLQRLYALCNGIAAFAAEAQLWTEAWNSSPAIPRSLRPDLEALLLPRRDPDNNRSGVLIPVLEGRARPVQGAQPEPRLAMQAEDVSLQSERRGDALTLLLQPREGAAMRVELDFALVREAASCSDGHMGVTELVHQVSPRLERFWGSALAPRNVSGSRLVLIDDDHEIVVHSPGRAR